MLMVMAPAPDNLLRFGVVCGKKFHKRAVRRNRARRLIWESVRRIKPQISSTENHLLFIPRPAILKCKQGDVQAELVKLLSRNKLFAETQNSGLHHPEC